MARSIKPADIQVGDLIRITRDLEVEEVSLPNDRRNASVKAAMNTWWSLVDAEITLIRRFLPDLPNKTGSVILTKLDEAASPWMLDSTARWISPNGAAMTSVQLRAHMEKFGLTFEVIA